MSKYAVLFTKSADSALRKLAVPIQKRITTAVDKLQDSPRPPNCVKLQGEDALWRIRVGDYRVVYAIRDEELIVLIVRIAHRKDVYRG